MLGRIVREEETKGRNSRDARFKTKIPPFHTSLPIGKDVDYYQLLQLPTTASTDEILRAYKRLALIHHPDKSSPNHPPIPAASNQRPFLAQNGSTRIDFRLLNEAKYVLSDPHRRAEYDATLIIHQGQARQETEQGPHISHQVSLEDFIPYYTDNCDMKNHDKSPVGYEGGGEKEEVEGLEKEVEYWTYPCRCSGQFRITREDLEEGVDVVGCAGCGEWVKVLYEVLEDGP
ncbi:hypothetical protein M231_00243 [Tremella mesenterica]|uniref:Diphthamide biosynthesis protein 4 n=1 Tax=Tremella mesenterica TaxID=5217 RepID=A0A4V1M555_TREME|nr:hypothetical protein M231_00243 [Tremella mesenterica]